MNSFYEKTLVLDELKKKSKPSASDLRIALELIKNDVELDRYFYGKTEQGVLNVDWLELLDSAGEFEGLGNKDASIIDRVKAFYIVDCAAKKPEVVLEIIKKVKIKDALIQRKMLDALLAMLEGIAIQGVPVVLEYFGGRNYKEWYFAGEPAAELMVKLIDKYPKEAFEIAKVLLDVWWPGEDVKSRLDNISTRFTTHEYIELAFQYYNKVWEKRPFEAVRVLIEIYDRYLEEYNKEKKYDTSEYLGMSVEDLENIGRLDYNLDAIILKAICESGRAVIEKEPKEVNNLLEDLERRNKGIFFRVMMYLLRFVKEGTETERINKMVGNVKFTENRMYWYEHRRLLNEKFENVDSATRDTFIKWVKEKKISEKQRKDIKEWCEQNKTPEPDFEKMENRERAEELYFARERFRELYEEYKGKAGVGDDSTLAPRKMIGETRFVSPMEGSPLSLEEMGKMACDAVLDYILEPKNYEGKKKTGEWRDAIDALRSTFKEDVKKRTSDYFKCDVNKLKELPVQFLDSFFYGVGDAVREGSFNKEGWELLIGFASLVVEERHKDEKYRDCFSEILSVLREGFGGGKGKLELDESTAKQFWEILKRLIRFPVRNIKDRTNEGDPIQLSLRHVAGKAMEITVLFGLVCKKRFEKLWEKELKAEMRECWEYVLENIREPGVNCMFGIEFARIYWIDGEWFEQNLDRILSGDLWDEIWGTYVSWGRPSPECFKVLVEKSKYGRAVELVGSSYKYKYEFRKEPNEGLVEHLIIGYFNGWIGYEDEVLQRFFENAPAELRGKAARFMTTGFKSVNEKGGKEKEKVAVRIREYWSKRLAAIKENPGENKDEAIELAGWVDDSVLQAKETLELLEKSLDLSGGKIGKMRGAGDFVKGVSELGKGNELLALRCLKKVAADENMHMTWSDIQDPLVKFLEDLPESVWSEGKEVADLYGRYNPEKFRGVWEKLNVIKRNEG